MSGFKLLIAKVLFSACLVIITAAASSAQSITGTISGTVVDPNGGVIPGASVTLTSGQLGDSRVVTTNDEGRFTFAAVRPGTYSVRIEHQGFQKLLRENTVLAANESLALGELALATGNVSETVTVTSAGAVVETQSSDLTARLTSDQISLIATKGRDVTSLLRLLPGTSNNDDIEGVGEGFGTDLPVISGQRGRSTVATVDGLNGSEPSGSNKLSLTINQDAVAEVQVLRNNYAAEYGNNGGAMINIVSKGGGSNYRGSAYYYLRNEALNANNFFNNKSRLPRALYRHKIWGFNAGGPIPLLRFGESDKMFIKNKAFFFFSYEKPRQITPTDPITVTVPTALERQGNFSQSRSTSGAVTLVDPLGPPSATNPFPIVNNIIPQQRINASGLALLNYYPLPNAGTTANPGLYSFQKSVDVRKRSMVIRFDVKPTGNDSIYWKKQWWTSDNEGLGTSGWPNGATGRDRWGISSHYLYQDDGWSANWVHIFSSKVVNEFNFGMRHDSEGFVPSDGMIEGLQRSALNYTAPQLFPQNNNLGTIPRATGWTSVQGNPANINWLDRWGETGNDYIEPSFADNLTWTQGDHTMKFGVYFERVRNGTNS
ncbi:MAG: carboxypeptidase regulatory-like domain-containing protein, partial [Pyrinomonadaceae bacterium]